MALRLNSRSLDILSVLVASEEPVAAAAIAGKLHLSPRMVRTSLGSASQWLRGQNITLRRVRGEGYSLLGSAESKRRLSEEIRTCEQPLPWLTPSERLYVTLLTLFFDREPTQIKQLQQRLNLSRTTTIKAVDAAEEWLHEYGLELRRKPNYGFAIVGEESNWREAAINLLLECAGDARLLALFQGMKTVVEVSYRTVAGLEKELGEVFRKLDLSSVRSALSSAEADFLRTLSDQAYIKLFICVAIAIFRSRMGKNVGSLPDDSKAALSAERIAATRQLAARIEKYAGIRLPEAEIGWLATRIPEPDRIVGALAKSPTTPAALGAGSAVEVCVARLVAQASLALHPGLAADADLIHNLTTHIGSLLTPQQPGSMLRNPLLREAKNRFPYVFSVAMQCSGVLSDTLGRALTETEVGDIAVCFIAAMERLRQTDRPTRRILVVCSEGEVTAWLLVSRLRAEFPDVEVVDAISAVELENRKHFEGIDFIVSTIPLRTGNIPSREVNPLLGLDDCRRLRELFARGDSLIPGKKGAEPGVVHLSDLITPQTIELGISARTWQEVVVKASARLLEQGLIEDRFIQAMKDVIVEHGPYMVIWPGVALLHAAPRGVRRLCMGFANLRKPVPFGHRENDPVRIAIVLGATDNHSHVAALQELNQMMQDEKARRAVQETVNKSVVVHWTTHYSKLV